MIKFINQATAGAAFACFLKISDVVTGKRGSKRDLRADGKDGVEVKARATDGDETDSGFARIANCCFDSHLRLNNTGAMTHRRIAGWSAPTAPS